MDGWMDRMKSNIYERHSKISKIKAIMDGEFHAVKWNEKRTEQNVNTFDLNILSEPR
jgi:hypothetical protein